ncbi:loricrin-like [Oppia nitens]|uniref:loricrin-like n=1 Tax=Oppia nitens TaxID=1686743 RepID=UPI0023DA9280|nr:loricrin-like [Oppia nitens]
MLFDILLTNKKNKVSAQGIGLLCCLIESAAIGGAIIGNSYGSNGGSIGAVSGRASGGCIDGGSGVCSFAGSGGCCISGNGICSVSGSGGCSVGGSGECNDEANDGGRDRASDGGNGRGGCGGSDFESRDVSGRGTGCSSCKVGSSVSIGIYSGVSGGVGSGCDRNGGTYVVVGSVSAQCSGASADNDNNDDLDGRHSESIL